MQIDKTFLLILSFFSFSALVCQENAVNSCDTIYLKSGEKIVCKVNLLYPAGVTYFPCDRNMGEDKEVVREKIDHIYYGNKKYNNSPVITKKNREASIGYASFYGSLGAGSITGSTATNYYNPGFDYCFGFNARIFEKDWFAVQAGLEFEGYNYTQSSLNGGGGYIAPGILATPYYQSFQEGGIFIEVPITLCFRLSDAHASSFFGFKVGGFIGLDHLQGATVSFPILKNWFLTEPFYKIMATSPYNVYNAFGIKIGLAIR